MWKAIPGFANYEASSSGKIRNKSTGKILKPKQTWAGYAEVSLMKNGKKHSKKVHRLVASAYGIKGKVIDHKNGNRTGNGVKNLKGASLSENRKNRSKTSNYQNRSNKRKWSSKSGGGK